MLFSCDLRSTCLSKTITQQRKNNLVPRFTLSPPQERERKVWFCDVPLGEIFTKGVTSKAWTTQGTAAWISAIWRWIGFIRRLQCFPTVINSALLQSTFRLSCRKSIVKIHTMLPLPLMFFCYHPNFGRHVIRQNQGLSSLILRVRRKRLWHLG